MSAGEGEETQSASGDGGAGGPGAPTPLSVLEVGACTHQLHARAGRLTRI